MESKRSKSMNTSVPTISIKFNKNAEEIEEICCVSDGEVVEEDNFPRQESQGGDSESSPLRIYLPRIGKRSTSVDIPPQDASPPSDPWKFFTDIKGKITKSVEGKLTEYKSKQEEGSPKSNKPKDSKENSSLSDSEEVSESSISRTCGILSTTEGVEMSSDDETPSLSEKPRVKSNIKNSETQPKSVGVPNEKTVRIKDKHTSITYEVSQKELIKLADIAANNDIESGVEAVEDLTSELSVEIDNVESTDEGLIIRTVDGEELRNAYLADNALERTVFAPTGFVDLRTPTSPRTGFSYYIYASRSIVVLIAILTGYFWSTIPIYYSGFICGSLVTLLACILYYMFCIKGILLERDELEQGPVFEIPPIKEYSPVSKFEGWVNEFPDEYNPHTYHVSQTQSVYLKLQGNLLKVSHTKAKIPKRALWNESIHKVQMTHHRIYNLLGAKISILPEGLARKRRWSKKYPICITLSPEQLIFDAPDPEALAKSKRKKSPKKKKTPKTTNDKEDDNKDAESIVTVETLNVESTEVSEASVRTGEDLLEESASVDESIASTSQMISDDSLTNTTVSKEEALNLLMNSKEEEVNYSSAITEKFLKEDMEEDWVSQYEKETGETRLFFFGRTDREKEDWFRRFVAATHKGAALNIYEETNEEQKESISDTLVSNAALLEEYHKYMQTFHKTKKLNKKHEKMYNEVSIELNREVSCDVFWVNALVGRILFDCMRDPDFTEKVRNRIQRKLASIKLPYFIEELICTELSLGSSPPLVHRAGAPIIDERGLWIDLDFSYEGLVALNIQTKINLLKLKEPPDEEHRIAAKNLAMFHSDVEDSAESSTDDDVPKTNYEKPVLDAQGMPLHGLGGASNSSKKFIRIVDKITESKIFKAATEYKYIKKAMEGVSNTELGLKVEVKACAGTLVLNIPPPPTDRVWMSFRPTPKLMLTANPIVGERNITYMQITSWIEQKLIQEFHKVLVIPNMEDLWVPMMCPELPR